VPRPRGLVLRRPADLTPELQGHLAMLAFSGLVAGSFSLGAMVANDIDPLALTAARFALATLLIGAVAAPRLRLAHGRAPWRYLVLGGLFSTYFVLMFEGLKTAPAVSTAAVFTLTPIMAAGFGWVLLRQITTPRMAAALAIGAAGALWVIFRADLGALIAFDIGRGEAIYFVGCIAHALYAPLVPKLNRGEPTVVFTFGMLVAGTLCLVVVGAPAIFATHWAALPPLVWFVIVYLAVVASSATFTLLQFASMRLKSAKVMAYTYLTPSFVILWEIALGRGAPPALVLGGVALTIAALLLLLKSD
jgi:drug/metabolite transporter (DMT)-like permease